MSNLKHLVMLSGGPDSAWPLKKLLLQTSDPVVALHVSLMEETRRNIEEDRACEQIAKFCRTAFREFSYETAKLVPPARFHSYADMTVLAAFAAMRCAGEGGFQAVWVGAEQEGGYGDREQAFRDVLSASMRAVTKEPAPTLSIPTEHKTKRDLYLDLGPELWDITWSCRKPRNGSACLQCDSCLNRRRAEGKELSESSR